PVREEPEEVIAPPVVVEKEAPKEKEVKETKEEAPQEVAPVIAEKAPVENVQAPADSSPVQTTAPEEPEVPPVIENIKAEKLEGPKILGKIELPVNSDTRPKP